jgi:hypothetical protein
VNQHKVCFGNHCFEAKVANTLLKKARGLMFRKQLPPDRGMLFIFGKEVVSPMWMFGMRFPIDIIWINAEKKVVDIQKNLPPCRGLLCPAYYPKQKAKYVLEINAGLCDEIGIRENSTVIM